MSFSDETSYVYFFYARGTNLVKVGSSWKDPLKRRANLQTGCPHKLIPLSSIRLSGNPRRWEYAVHEAWKDFRVHGEWFEAEDWDGMIERTLSQLLAKIDGAVIEDYTEHSNPYWVAKDRPVKEGAE